MTALLDKPIDVDLSKVKIEVPQIELPPLDFGRARNNSGRSSPHNRKPRSFAPGFLFCVISLDDQLCALRAMKLS